MGTIRECHVEGLEVGKKGAGLNHQQNGYYEKERIYPSSRSKGKETNETQSSGRGCPAAD